jgi:LPXTG-site transpeptidase (sortase) family protein
VYAGTDYSMKLAKINNILLALIIVVNVYVILAPLAPAVFFWWQNRGGTKRQTLSTQIYLPSPPAKAAVEPNSVTIPSMLLDKPILEGRDTYAILNKGIWRWPAGSTPEKGSNTVFIGHRFTYTQPKGVFYYLNKVSGVTWNTKHYLYKVDNIHVVPPTDTSIENPTSRAQLTLFTCTPLWLPKDRLVVVAGLERTL